MAEQRNSYHHLGPGTQAPVPVQLDLPGRVPYWHQLDETRFLISSQREPWPVPARLHPGKNYAPAQVMDSHKHRGDQECTVTKPIPARLSTFLHLWSCRLTMIIDFFTILLSFQGNVIRQESMSAGVGESNKTKVMPAS